MKHSKQINIRRNPSNPSKLNLGLVTLGISVLAGAYLIFSKDKAKAIITDSSDKAVGLQKKEAGVVVDTFSEKDVLKDLPALKHKAIEETDTEKLGIKNQLFGFFGHFFTQKNAQNVEEEFYYPYLDTLTDNPIPPRPTEDDWVVKNWVQQNEPTRFVVGYRMLSAEEIEAKKKAFEAAQEKEKKKVKAAFPADKETNIIAMFNFAMPSDEKSIKSFDTYFAKEEKDKRIVPLDETWAKKKNNRPEFDENINPAQIPNGLLAKSLDKRAENAIKIAVASGKTDTKKETLKTDKDFKKLIPKVSEFYQKRLAKLRGLAKEKKIPINTLISKDPYIKQDELLSQEGIIYALACLLACEGNDFTSGYNLYQRQREYVAILWSLVNRCSIGYAARQLKKECTDNSANLHRAIGLAVSYTDPMLWIAKNPRSKKKETAIALMPLVKAFFMGYFNEETPGSTHWFHIDAGVYPPLYYFKQGTLTRSGEPIEPYRLSSPDSGLCFINNCFFTKVND